MGLRGAERVDRPAAEGTPEDVAALFSWANLREARYRDYSAARREYRAQMRYRAAKALLERRLEAQAEAERSAAAAEREAWAAEAQSEDPSVSLLERLHSLNSAEAAARRASGERVEAAHRADAAAQAAVLALREEREIAQAHASARWQEMAYMGWEPWECGLVGAESHWLIEADAAQNAAQAESKGGQQIALHQLRFGAEQQDGRTGEPARLALGPGREQAGVEGEEEGLTMGPEIEPNGTRSRDADAEIGPAWLSRSEPLRAARGTLLPDAQDGISKPDAAEDPSPPWGGR
jgi:hypothetical protein